MSAASTPSFLIMDLGEQLGAALGEPYERPALVQHQPAALDRQIQACVRPAWTGEGLPSAIQCNFGRR